MAIIFHQASKEFHLYNAQISYIIKILENGQLGHVYYGKHITDVGEPLYLKRIKDENKKLRKKVKFYREELTKNG